MSKHFLAVLSPFLLPIRLDALGFFFINFLIPIVAHQHFDASGLQMGVLFSLQALGTGLSALIFAKKVNHWHSRASLIRLASWIKAFAYLSLYIAIIHRHYGLMIVATLCLGLGSGLFWLVWQTCFAQLSKFEHRAEVFGHASKQVGIGIMIGSCFAFTLLGLEELSEYITYLSLPVFAIACFYAGKKSYAMLMTIQLDQSSKTPICAKKPLLFIAVFLFALIFIGQLSGSLVAPFLEVYLLEQLHIKSVSELALAYIPGGIISMLLAPKLGQFADKMNAALYLCIAGIIGASTTWLMLQSVSLWQISLLFMIDASVITSSGLVLAKLISEVAGENKGSVFGLQAFVSNSGAIAGPLIGGVFWQYQGSKGPFIFSISVELFLASCCLFILLPMLYRKPMNA